MLADGKPIHDRDGEIKPDSPSVIKLYMVIAETAEGKSCGSLWYSPDPVYCTTAPARTPGTASKSSPAIGRMGALAQAGKRDAARGTRAASM